MEDLVDRLAQNVEEEDWKQDKRDLIPRRKNFEWRIKRHSYASAKTRWKIGLQYKKRAYLLE